MRKTKHCIAQFMFYDRTGIQAFLEKEAQRGWMLEHVGQLRWRFRRIEPKKIHFAVTYFPKASLFDPEPSESQERLQEFCAHAGWILAGATAQMQIFYNEAEDPVPIETDPMLELENIHESAKKSFLPSYYLLLAVCILQMGMFLWQLHNSLLGTLSSNLNLFPAFCWAGLFLECVFEILRYFLWRRKALAAAQTDGSFVKTRGFRTAQLVLLWVYLASFVLMVSSLGGKMAAVTLSGVVLMSALVLLVLGIREGLKRLKFSAQDNRIITIVSCIVLSLLVCGVGTTAVFTGIDSLWPEENESTYEYKGHTFTSYDDVLPLKIQDLREDAEGEYSYYFKGDCSLLMEKYVARQDPHVGNLDLPSLRYVIVDVKLPWLHDECLEALLDQYAGWEYTDVYGNVYHDEFIEVDAAPWGADAAYQGYNGEYPETEYILCYGRRIVDVDFDWEPTAQQMKIIETTFG